MHKLAILTLLGLALVTTDAGAILHSQSDVTHGPVPVAQAQEFNLLVGGFNTNLGSNIHSTVGSTGELSGHPTAVPEGQHVTLMTLLGFLLLGAVQSFRKPS